MYKAIHFIPKGHSDGALAGALHSKPPGCGFDISSYLMFV